MMNRIVLLSPPGAIDLRVGTTVVRCENGHPVEVAPELQAELLARNSGKTVKEALAIGEQMWADPDADEREE